MTEIFIWEELPKGKSLISIGKINEEYVLTFKFLKNNHEFPIGADVNDISLPIEKSFNFVFEDMEQLSVLYSGLTNLINEENNA